jgi:hypothetical protein
MNLSVLNSSKIHCSVVIENRIETNNIQFSKYIKSENMFMATECQTHQHKTDLVTPDFCKKQTWIHPHHKRHHSLVCTSCYQSPSELNFKVFRLARVAYLSSQACRTMAIILGANYEVSVAYIGMYCLTTVRTIANSVRSRSTSRH